jgi:phosphoserine phosphatase
MMAARPLINGIDLDGTLLPYDSMRRYLFLQLRAARTVFGAAWLTALRQTGGLGRAEFVERLVRSGRRMKGYDVAMRRLADSLYADIDPRIMRLVRDHSPAGITNVLCTASPSDYVGHLAARLGWPVVCTRLEQGTFMHVHGLAKAAEFTRRFPPSEYEYNFAVADSKSDEALLRLFRHPLLLQENKPAAT